VDILISGLGLLVLSPLLVPVLFLVWLQDRHSPFYIAPRAGVDGTTFRMVKVRSMVKGADKTGVESTSASDNRITALGHFIRRYKIDELGQLWNVLMGDMSLVGPRPNTLKSIASYTSEERRLLSVPPGITDFSSIVFSDEGEILKDAKDADAEYDRLIRPWKSELGLLYVDKHSFGLDLKLILLTALAISNKKAALKKLQPILARLGADPILLRVARRENPLQDFV
jgi:lipopolysaccharide/colanic/teichoic acid biosynthesis glycosyltransferase